MTYLSKIDTHSAEPTNDVLRADTSEKRLLADRLADGIAPKLLPVFDDIQEEIRAAADNADQPGNASHHAEAIAQYCIAQIDRITQLQAAEEQFQTRLAHAVDLAEERAAILDFARALGADRKQLQSDRNAFGQWFDSDAALERFQKRIGERERALAHAIERLGHITAEAVASEPHLVDSAFFISLFDDLLARSRAWIGDARIRHAAHDCLATIALKIDRWPFGAWLDRMLSATRRVCLDENEDTWVQCAAFDALMALSPASITPAVKARIAEPLSAKTPAVADKELFLRRHLVRLVVTNFTVEDSFAKLLGLLVADEAGSVRQAVADVLHIQ